MREGRSRSLKEVLEIQRRILISLVVGLFLARNVHADIVSDCLSGVEPSRTMSPPDTVLPHRGGPIDGVESGAGLFQIQERRGAARLDDQVQIWLANRAILREGRDAQAARGRIFHPFDYKVGDVFPIGPSTDPLGQRIEHSSLSLVLSTLIGLGLCSSPRGPPPS